MIALDHLTKRYGGATVVRDLTAQIRPGRVTGFLGPNGAGKSTTMRLILGLDHPTAGAALVNGRRYAQLPDPLRAVGALLDARSVHPGRSGRGHLLAMARSNGIGRRRVEQVLEQVGLAAVAGRRAGSYSLGMGQRLGIAGAMLGDPPVLMFDEPVNGLDLDGVRWIRQLTRTLADEGRTVLLSSHLMSELQQLADHLLVIGQGRLLADAPTGEVIAAGAAGHTHVRCAGPAGAAALRERLTARGYVVTVPDGDPHSLQVPGAAGEQVGDSAHEVGAALHELRVCPGSLEQAYLTLTGDSVEFAAPAHAGVSGDA